VLRFAAAGLCIASLAIGAASLGIAQAREQGADGTEVPIGTFTLGPREAAPPHDGLFVEPPAGGPDRVGDSADDGSGRWFFQGWDTPRSRGVSAEDLYRDAKAALDQGRRDDAQRLFERLIAEAPDSPRVAAARQYLGQIYRSVETAAPVAPVREQAADPSEDAELPWRRGGTAPGDDARTGVAGISSAVPRATLYQARVSPVIDSEFLSDAGDRVFFGAGSANLGARARGVIQAQARFLMRYPDLYAAVEGHADDGAMSDIETLRISEERAAVVRDRLIAEGVDAARLMAYGRGREERVSDCSAPDCLAQNRRAVTVLLSRRVEAAPQPSRRAQGGVPTASDVSPTQ
jgi:peptidoglycan-associated lipoprotein